MQELVADRLDVAVEPPQISRRERQSGFTASGSYRPIPENSRFVAVMHAVFRERCITSTAMEPRRANPNR
jgi:hypothetical protein